jgi:hypothetical protein
MRGMITSTSPRLTHAPSLPLLVALLSSMLGLSACSDDASPADTGARLEAGADTSAPDLSLGDLFRSDAGTCAELSATDCFSNLDCSSDRRCQSLDGVGLVVCCLPGPRGTKAAGDPCTGAIECASAVCIAKGQDPSVCSKDCQSEADCPTGMKDCKTIAFSGSPQKWCFPQ